MNPAANIGLVFSSTPLLADRSEQTLHDTGPKWEKKEECVTLIGKQASDIQESPVDIAFIHIDGTSHLLASIGRDHRLRLRDIQVSW
ncbi:unnamed protein product [Schistocephalus solidus]|uniref:Secreted protein n=1 Tax=Schistocephalus solidus TaxID=70667 RepID=A0A183TSB8_SCHSO|nr:unnamed protein product [Schistocephalus solidus]